jgi:hypothetical protein
MAWLKPVAEPQSRAAAQRPFRERNGFRHATWIVVIALTARPSVDLVLGLAGLIKAKRKDVPAVVRALRRKRPASSRRELTGR